jgi:phosphoglycolate phosphatase
MKSKKLIIFDCDGTLMDSQHAIVGAMNHCFKRLSLAPPTRLQTLSTVGLSLSEAFDILSPTPEHKEKLIEAFKSEFLAQRERQEVEPFYEGAQETLKRLYAHKNVALGLATGKSRRGVNYSFTHYGILNWFDTIQTADDAPSKPHPAMVQQAILATGVKAKDVLMIGDTSFDMHMARAAGIQALGVSWGYHDVAALEEAGAHEVVDDYEELNEYLEDNGYV